MDGELASGGARTGDCPSGGPGAAPQRGSGKYSSLHKYLENRYADVIVLTFGQIEDLLGFALPQRARNYHAWWTLGETNVDGPPHSDAWILAGRTATPNLQARTVIFERTSTARPGLE